MSIRLLKIDLENVNELTPFAKEVFIDYYLPQLGINQCNYMVNLFLSEKAFIEKLEHNHQLSLYYKDDQKCAFTEYLIDEERIFLSKLYVHKDYRGQGIGQIMLQEVIDYAKIHHKKAIYLTVNKYNEKTIQIYKHLNFKVIDSVVSDIGESYVMDDYIMELKMTD